MESVMLRRERIRWSVSKTRRDTDRRTDFASRRVVRWSHAANRAFPQATWEAFRAGTPSLRCATSSAGIRCSSVRSAVWKIRLDRGIFT